MSTIPQSSLTILFEAPFWIGIYERTDNDKYEVCKITFGSEPKDYEVYGFLLKNWHKLKFSLPIQAETAMERKINPKRMQREIHSQLQNEGIAGIRQIFADCPFCTPFQRCVSGCKAWKNSQTPMPLDNAHKGRARRSR